MTLRANSLRCPSAAGFPEDPVTVTDGAPFAGRHLLLVEDNPINRLVVRKLLTKYGARVTEAEDGAVALEKLRACTYDLVLMDVRLPQLDGLEVTRILREEISATVPVIALTASSLPGEQEICLQAGMNDFVHKAFEEGSLVALLCRWLERKNIALQPKAAAVPGPVACDLSRLRSISNGDEAFVRRMLLLFIQEMPAAVEKIKAALEEEDLVTVRYIAHRIQPAAHNLGITGLAADIRKLESLAAYGTHPGYLKELLRVIGQTIDNVVDQLRAELAS